MNWPVACGVVGMGSAPRSRRNLASSALPSAWPIWRLSSSVTAGGVPAGASTAAHPMASKPG
ncbi:Uncharacterised protein [Bordetella pertussis]|nr:Uncharacterised protein [Bordetella pertussis]